MKKLMKTLAVAGMTMGLALGAQAVTTNDYGIVLLEGKAHKDKTTGADITADVAAMGLACADGIWKMKNFNFTTTADVALSLADDQTMIKISGQNVVRSATTNCVGVHSAGIDTNSGGDLLIKGDGLSDTLDVFGGSDPDHNGYGISVSSLAIEDATVNASADNKAKTPCDLFLSSSLSVSNGVMNATANSTMGIWITGKSGGIIVSGTGKINIKASDTAVITQFSTEPDAVARSGAATLTWGETTAGSGVYTYFNGSDVANDVTLTAKDAPEPKTPVEYLEPVYKEIGGVTSVTNGIDHWLTNSVSAYTVVESATEMVTWNAGWYVVKSDVTIESSVICSNNVKLILCDGVTLTVNGGGNNAGIETDPNGSFTVYGQKVGTGALTVTANCGIAAAIGGGIGGAGSNITINGGTVTATGDDSAYGAVIGGGYGGAGSNITINAGTVTAKGGDNANGAAIGGGGEGTGSDITINGGTVEATVGGYASGAAIGGGNNGAGSNITVNAGTVTATVGERANGAAIGGGGNKTGSNITINGGTVEASCGGYAYGAAIGGGNYGVGSDITINGGTVEASCGESASGAAIGGGSNGTGLNITVDPKLLVKADNNNPPTTVIAHASITEDIANKLADKRYATVTEEPPEPIAFEVKAPAGATAAVYTNAVEAANLVAKGGTVWSNGTAYVVYTANAGKYFENGATAVTNTLDTTTNPAKDANAPTSTGTPKIELGAVAQRYPWNGTLDVTYRATYVKDTPATLTVTVNGKAYTQDVTLAHGTNTLAFTKLPANIKAKDAKATLTLK